MTASGSAEIVDMADARARMGAEPAGDGAAHSGLRLAQAREARGASIAEAAARTHIRESHLVAIEAADASGLPPRAYALGFVKTYAEYLELESRAVVEQFKIDAGYDAPAPIETEKFGAAEEAAQAEPGELSLPVFIAILAFILWSAWQITTTGKVTPIGEGEGPTAPAFSEPAVTPPLEAGAIVEARAIERIEPVYPFSCTANAAPVETVSVAFTVTAGGRVAAERIAGTTNNCFDQAALNALRRWRFEPRTVDGAVRPSYDQTHSFTFSRP